jgi:hypothetical protein
VTSDGDDVEDWDVDPEAMIGMVRLHVRTWVNNGSLSDADTASLVKYVDLLDEWMSSGREPPLSWQCPDDWGDYAPPRPIEDVELPPYNPLD